MEEIYNNLALAFGGYSQINDTILGMALIGQINNNGLIFSEESLDEMVNIISKQWSLSTKDELAVRNDILTGMKIAAEHYCLSSIPENVKNLWSHLQIDC